MKRYAKYIWEKISGSEAGLHGPVAESEPNRDGTLPRL